MTRPENGGGAKQHEGGEAGGGETAAGVWIVCPAYREEAVVGQVVSELRGAWPHVVVVDDGSPDHTAERARAAGARVVRHPINRGQGAALQTGIRYALEQGAQVVVTFDSDGQHDPADLPALIAPIIKGEAEVVLGSRFLGAAEGISRRRWLLLKLAVLFTRVASGLPVTDTHNGLRAFSRRAARRLDLLQDGMAHASELLDQVARSGLPIEEVPVHIRYTEYSRGKGQRSLGAFKVLIDYLLRRLF